LARELIKPPNPGVYFFNRKSEGREGGRSIKDQKLAKKIAGGNQSFCNRT